MSPGRDRHDTSPASPTRGDIHGTTGEDETLLASSGWSSTSADLGLMRRLERNDPNTTVFELDRRDLNSAQSRILGHILGRNAHVTWLMLEHCCLDVTELCAGLQNNRSIDTLFFSGIDLDANRMNSLATVLTNTPIQSITLTGCSIGQADINTLSAALPDRLCDLDLSWNPLGDVDLDQLIRVLRSGRIRLESLCLGECGIGVAGCSALAALLEQEGSSLSCLRLWGNNLDDECVIRLAESLGGLRTLERLTLDNNRGITTRGWKALLDLICGSTSIKSVELSNHALFSLVHDETQMMLEANDRHLLRESLELNRTHDKKAVVRQKLLRGHIKGPLNVGEFAVVASALLPALTSAADENAERLLQSFCHDPPLPAPAFAATRLDALFRVVRSRPEWCLRIR